MTATPTGDTNLALATRYVVSFAAGVLAGVVFWLLCTPTPVPPLIGLVGLLGIAFGEILTGRAIALILTRRDPTARRMRPGRRPTATNQAPKGDAPARQDDSRRTTTESPERFTRAPARRAEHISTAAPPVAASTLSWRPCLGPMTTYDPVDATARSGRRCHRT